jgi:hypothetical protein
VAAAAVCFSYRVDVDRPGCCAQRLGAALIMLSALTRAREAPLIPASCETELRRADRPARAGAAAAGRRRHFFLVELLIADSG